MYIKCVLCGFKYVCKRVLYLPGVLFCVCAEENVFSFALFLP
jgi:hypothetical protein